MACSLACLRRHQKEVHGDALPIETATRMRAFQREGNRRAPGNWDRYAPHRRQLMDLVAANQAGPDLCVFGAGNCSDIDLEVLSKSFEQIHLVDLDAEALERARERLPLSLRTRVVLHADVDLSGLLDHLDEWSEKFPEPNDLGPIAVAAAHRILRSLGRSFGTTLSTGVLSQLVFPYHRVWVRTRSEWENLDATTTAVHLATLAGATRSGGKGIIAVDALSSEEAPELTELAERSADDLQSFVRREIETGRAALDPDPANLLAQLRSPGLGSLFASLELTNPWLWNTGNAIQLVYGLVFLRT